MNNKGFTLIELLIVLLILGILGSMAVPSLAGTVEMLKLRADAQKMAGVLRMARQDAITSGQTSKVVFYADSNRYKNYDSSSPRGATYLLNKGNIICGVPNFTPKILGNPACIFYSTGAPVAGGTVTLKNKYNQKLYVIVNLVVGRIRISDKPPDNWN